MQERASESWPTRKARDRTGRMRRGASGRRTMQMQVQEEERQVVAERRG